MRLLATDPDLETLIARIERSDIDLQPDFQRGEIWPSNKKRRLIDSILRGWHVPPIHLVVRENGIHEVLDGQQRLAAIRDFVRNEFSVDGNIEPNDVGITSLDRMRHRDLPDDVKRQFNSFTIRTFLLTDYNPEEPGELFFRLNQISSLTSAEQRNAFYGEARDQVRSVVEFLSQTIGEHRVGFSNKRMAYDDVVSKFLYHCEVGKIAVKTTSFDLSQRFRESVGFSSEHVADAKEILRTIFNVYDGNHSHYRLNKAILLSWMLFLYRAKRSSVSYIAIEQYLHIFEYYVDSVNKQQDLNVSGRDQIILQLVKLFIDRASFRVSDVSSVVARDFALWTAFVLATPEVPNNFGPNIHDERTIFSVLNSVDWQSDTPTIKGLQSRIGELADWGKLNAQG